jgi:hypothetical protein
VNGDWVSLQIDYAEATVPDHYYVADYFRVELHGSSFLFVFGKTNSPDENHLRNKIELFFPVTAFLGQLWTSSRAFHEILRKYVAEINAPAQERHKVNEDAGAQVRTLHSNNVMMALAGGETILDFFYISPKEVWARPKRGEEIPLEPVIRVMLEPADVLKWLDECGEFVGEAKSYVHPAVLKSIEAAAAEMEGSHEQNLELGPAR